MWEKIEMDASLTLKEIFWFDSAYKVNVKEFFFCQCIYRKEIKLTLVWPEC